MNIGVKTLAGTAEPEVTWVPLVPPIFDRSVNHIPTGGGGIMPTKLLLSPPNLLTFRHPCLGDCNLISFIQAGPNQSEPKPDTRRLELWACPISAFNVYIRMYARSGIDFRIIPR